jgi:hypothetical protein
MGTTTFSGPVKAGTIKETTGTTLGSDSSKYWTSNNGYNLQRLISLVLHT